MPPLTPSWANQSCCWPKCDRHRSSGYAMLPFEVLGNGNAGVHQRICREHWDAWVKNGLKQLSDMVDQARREAMGEDA